MGVLQKVSYDDITRKISFLFRNEKAVALDFSAFLFPGLVLINARADVPFGFLLCDGSPVSRTMYPNLFNAISTAHGDGTKNADGTNSIYSSGQAFNLPDYRGRFLRGVDGSAGRDANKATRTAANTGGSVGNSVGSVQANETKINSLTVSVGSGDTSTSQALSHSHGLTSSSEFFSAGAGGPSRIPTASEPNRIHATSTGGNSTANASIPHTHNITPSVALNNGDSETRPVNVYLHHIIKY